MLSLSDKAKMRGAYETTISTLGVPVSYSPAKNPAAVPVNLVVGFKTVGINDQELTNAYGVGAKIITIAAKDLGTKPEKFDQVKVTATGEVLTISTVSDVHLNGDLVGYRLSTAGK